MTQLQRRGIIAAILAFIAATPSKATSKAPKSLLKPSLTPTTSTTSTTSIVHKRPEAPAALRLLSARNDEIIYAKDYGLTGDYAQDATESLRDALHAVPNGGVIEFSHGFDVGAEFKVTDTLLIDRRISLRGKSSRLIGVMADDCRDLVRYAPTSEIRGVSVTGMRLGFNAGGRHALNFGDGHIGILGCTIADNDIVGGTGGYALYMDGVGGPGNHFNNILRNSIGGTSLRAGGIYLGCADGTSVKDNIIYGVGHGICCSLINGAYKTNISGNAITSRDIGILIVAGQQIDIEHNQFEQGRIPNMDALNQARRKAHIVVDGTTPMGIGQAPIEEVRDIRIIANNFGSGSNQDSSIIIAGPSIDIIIDENVFANLGRSGFDIALLGQECRWTRVGPRNRAYGNRGVGPRRSPNTADPKTLIRMLDRGNGTYGFAARRRANLASGWTGPELIYWKDEQDVLHFEGRLKAGNNLAQTSTGCRIMQLADGFRPARPTLLTVPTDGSQMLSLLLVEPDGFVRCHQTVPPNSSLDFGSVSLAIKGRSAYLSGPF